MSIISVPDNIINKTLYRNVKKASDKIFERHGLYKSAWIQKEYKKRGGKYRDKKPSRSIGLRRWIDKEQWIEVGPYLERDEKVPCGSSNRKGKACRPLIRATEKTPITLSELLKIHSKTKLKNLVNKKRKDMDGRLNWKAGTFTPSKK